MEGATAAQWLVYLTGARPWPEANPSRHLAALGADAWVQIVNLAVTERIAPLAATRLRAQGLLEAVPPAARMRLETARRATHLQYLLHTHVLAELATVLEPAGIPFRLLKGLALGAQAYPSSAARAVGDIDLWVRPRDLGRAEAALVALGYRPSAAAYAPPGYIHAYLGEISFTSPRVPVEIELHWHLLNAWWYRANFRVPEGRLFAATEIIRLGDRTFPTLAPTHAAFYLCLHSLAGQHPGGWRCLLDIHLLAQRRPIDWDLVADLAAGSGTEILVWRTLQHIDRLFGTGYRRHLGWAPPRARQWLVRLAVPAPVPGEQGQVAPADVVVPLPNLALLPSYAAIARTLARMAWPSARWIRLRYGVHVPRAVWQARLGHLWRVRALLPGRAKDRSF